jgi:flavodoxin
MYLERQAMKNQKCLVAYFSRKGSNLVNGKVVDLLTGNTEVIAKIIQEETGGDLFRIEAVKAYPVNYGEMAELAREELRTQARPEITGMVKDVGGYEVLFLGYPNWWDTMPMAVYTFLEKHRLTGLTIAPFCTHEGTGMGRSEQELARICPAARVANGLAIHGGHVQETDAEIKGWVKRVLEG